MATGIESGGRRTPPGSPPNGINSITNGSSKDTRRRPSNGFAYPTVEVSGAVSSSRIIYYDGDIGLLTEQQTNGSSRLPENTFESIGNGSHRRPSHDGGVGGPIFPPEGFKRTSNGTIPHYQEMTISRRNSLKASVPATATVAPIQAGPSPPRTRHELDSAKRVIDNKNREIDALRIALENAKTEAARRTSQARVFREGDTTLRKEIGAIQEQLKEQSDALRVAERANTELSRQRDAMAGEITMLRGELSHKNTEISQLRTSLQSGASAVTSLKERLKDALSKLEEASEIMKQDKATINALRSDITSYKAREELLERNLDAQSRALQLLQDSLAKGLSGARMASPREVLVQVGLPGGRRGEFLVRADRGEDPTQAAEAFAIKNRLGRAATRALVAFTRAECAASFAGTDSSHA